MEKKADSYNNPFSLFPCKCLLHVCSHKAPGRNGAQHSFTEDTEGEKREQVLGRRRQPVDTPPVFTKDRHVRKTYVVVSEVRYKLLSVDFSKHLLFVHTRIQTHRYEAIGLWLIATAFGPKQGMWPTASPRHYTREQLIQCTVFIGRLLFCTRLWGNLLRCEQLFSMNGWPCVWNSHAWPCSTPGLKTWGTTFLFYQRGKLRHNQPYLASFSHKMSVTN